MSLNILKKNISAIKLAIQLNKEEKNPTQEDLAILNTNNVIELPIEKKAFENIIKNSSLNDYPVLKGLTFYNLSL